MAGRNEPEAGPAFRQLCHMLSLSKTRKVQSAVDNLVLTTLSIDPEVGDGGDPNQLALAISTYFGVTLDVGDVRAAIENDLRAGRLFIDRSDDPHRFVLAPAPRAEVAERIQASQRLEDDVRAEWLGLPEVEASGLAPGQLWNALQHYLGQVFRQHGAEAVQLLDSRRETEKDKGTLPRLLDISIDSAGLQPERETAKSLVRLFFTDPSAKRLRYMSELLDGTFTFFALSVSDSTADYLKNQVPSLRLFLDTNVVLAVLGLQDNPLQEADLELLEVIKTEKYPFKLYYHERTLREILDILDAARANLRRRHFTPALSAAYLQYMERRTGGFGLERQFHALNATREIDTEAFLARFDHVEELLRERGVQKYNQSGAELDTEAKGSYIAEFDHHLKTRLRSGKTPRRYEALDHDITVWMYLQRMRSNSTNALRSGALLLSNDYSLHSFDRSFLMGSPSGKRVATIVLPHHLLQILRPFSRVTADFDEKFMSIFAAPEFRTTQTNYEQTASKVLAYLSSFEGVPTETAVHILNDDLLMGRLEDAAASDVEFGELIESAVIEENASLVAGLSAASAQLAEAEEAARLAERTADAERASREEAESRSQELRAAARDAVEEAKREAREEQEKRRAERVAREAADLEAQQQAAAQAKLAADLEEERRLRIDAQNMAAARGKRLKLIRHGLGVAVLIVGALAVVVLPAWIGWTAFLERENRYAIQALSIVLVGGVAYVVGGGSKHRSLVVAGFLVGGLLTLLSLL